jgi:hypothetical protein
MDSADWASEWPRCLLLLELATRYATSGRTHGCEKLKDRLEEWRVRMDGAPTPVHMLLSELCYVVWLVGRGDLATARHHATVAGRKAQEIGVLIQRQQCMEVRRHSSSLRWRSRQLQGRAHELLERSDRLLKQSSAARGRARQSALCKA